MKKSNNLLYCVYVFIFFSQANHFTDKSYTSASFFHFKKIPYFSSNFSLYLNPIHKTTPEELKNIIDNDIKNYIKNNINIIFIYENQEQQKKFKDVLDLYKSTLCKKTSSKEINLSFEHIQKKEIKKK